MKRISLVALALMLFAAACGGRGANLAPGIPPGLDGAAAGKSAALLDAGFIARLRALQDNPGQAGVDYDPRHITVHYNTGVQFPAQLSAAPGDPAQRAAAQGNPSLRANKQFEPLTDAIAARYGLLIHTQVYLEAINMAGFAVPPGVDGTKVLARLRAEFAPYITYAGFAQYYEHCMTLNDPDYYSTSPYPPGPQWGHRKIHCAEAFDYTTGDPAVRIAICDTGVRITHEELRAQVLDPQVAFPAYKLDIVNNDNTMEDTEGHGTFIAGLIASQVNDGRTLAGAAYNCQVIPIKITNNGSATDQDIYAGCLLADQLGAKAINLSFGDTHNDPYLEDMVNQIVSHGHLFVGAAGNNNSQTIEYPGGYANSLCVGATDPDDARSPFSNYGSWVDIAAPGQWLKSCKPDTDTSYNDWTDGSGSGTSFAAPLVAAAAGLLWSFDHTLTNTQVRDFLTSTGAPTTGFNNNGVLRLDIAAALAAVNKLELRAPAPSRLVQSGTITMQPYVSGSVDSVDGTFNGIALGSQTAAPFNFTIDTTSVTFGTAALTFTAHRGSNSVTDTIDLLIDNTTQAFPLQEDFESGGASFTGIDVKKYALSLLQQIKMYPGPGTNWTQTDILNNGPAQWTVAGTGGYQSQGCAHLGTPGNNYGDYEIDALVSRRIDLTGINAPTLAFYQHYNIEDGGAAHDRGYCCVTDNEGQTFSVVPLAGGGTLWTGYQPDYALAQVDLSAFANKIVHVLLVFESDAQNAGEQNGPPGWWVDNLTVAENYSTVIPTMSGVNVPNGSVYGAVPQRMKLALNPIGAKGLDRVRYILDLDPVGTIGSNDIQVVTSTAPFTAEINLPNVPNQLAQLKVNCWGSGNVAGPSYSVPVYLFNLAGDANADNKVDQLDSDLINSKLGLANTDAGYSPFCDSNMDGVIDERDNAAVGYFWGGSI